MRWLTVLVLLMVAAGAEQVQPESRDLADRAIAVGEQSEPESGMGPLVSFSIAGTYLKSGREDEARRVLDHAFRILTAPPYQHADFVHFLLAKVLAGLGEVKRPIDLMSDHWGLDGGNEERDPGTICNMMRLLAPTAGAGPFVRSSLDILTSRSADRPALTCVAAAARHLAAAGDVDASRRLVALTRERMDREEIHPSAAIDVAVDLGLATGVTGDGSLSQHFQTEARRLAESYTRKLVTA